MNVYSKIIKNTYYDSVTLMLITKSIEEMKGTSRVLVAMGTKLNKDLASSLRISTGEIENTTVNDLFIAFSAESQKIFDSVMAKVNELLNKRVTIHSEDYQVPTLESAIKKYADTNLVMISVPGKYAFKEARTALDSGKHVMLFSDNVSYKEELELKQLALKKGLLMMGPDCGTAIINHKPLGFANAISKGGIGIVGASGTGIQEVTVLVDSLGEGVSQVIGTGGRDLRSEIGGLMMYQGFKALIEDKNTKTIVLIAKNPDREVVKKILNLARETSKPVVTCFTDIDRELIERYGAYCCETLKDTAIFSVRLCNQASFDALDIPLLDELNFSDEKLEKLVIEEIRNMKQVQKYIVGLFVGGTLATEAVRIISKGNADVYSNVPIEEKYKILGIQNLNRHICLDLGDDVFTLGRPHPMIDPSIRTEMIRNDIKEDAAILLLDIVFGYGSHRDPVGEMLEALTKAKESFKKNGGYLSVICSICGTKNDPQDYDYSKKRLEDIGVIVMPSNEQAAYLTKLISDAVNPQKLNFSNIFNEEISVINVGLNIFFEEMKKTEMKVVNVDWRPTAGGNEKMLNLLSKLKEKN